MLQNEETTSEPDFMMEELSDEDDDTPIKEATYPVPQVIFRSNNLIYRCFYVAYLASFGVYLYIRLLFTLDAPAGISQVYCVFIAVLEFTTAPALMIHGLCLWNWYSRSPPEVNEKEHSMFHTTRILVPTFKEPLEVVSGTVREIIHLDVPDGLHVHVYVLDDGCRKQLEEWVLSRRTKRHVFLHYIARPKLSGNPHHAKSGNINHLLHFIYDRDEPENECVIVFDADFMPKREFLTKVLPVFSEQRGKPIALVQTPQYFYNVNPDEDMWDHMNTSFFHRIEPSLDRWGAVNCCGTNFVIRSDALKEAGYLPIGCLTEDTLLSLRLCAMGWGVAYHHEILAVGQAPNEIASIFKQRGRWCKGNIQIFLDEFPLLKSGLSLPQRLFYSSLGFSYICIAISTPIFQLIPVWAILFGLWPISRINLEFAISFIVYYGLSNIILLCPPSGFAVKDMWSGELASVNFWLTFFQALRGVLAAKFFGGELTFETTEKKKDGESERHQVGFRWKDVRVCYMHFTFLLFKLGSVVYAVTRAIVAENVTSYYTSIIGMSWALMGMVPYVGVVIYCYYRVRIPGIALSVLRNVQLVLRVICVGLILAQSLLVQRESIIYDCPHNYQAELGVHRLTITRVKDIHTGQEVERNAFWLLGVDDDFYTIEQVKKLACEEKTVPVIVFAMLPKDDLVLNAEISHYLPDNHINTWEEYDARMLMYAQELKDIPSVIVMEPSLLMHTFNYENKYWNWNYQFAFFERIYVMVRVYKRSWVYVDAGNPLFLQWQVNMDYMVGVLEQLQSTIRGFSINVGSYINTTLTTDVADALYCRTGLHYVIDTSRNGGMFSERPLSMIDDCKYDPPQVAQGHLPAWREGSKQVKLKVYNRIASLLIWQKRGQALRFRRRADPSGLVILEDKNATCEPTNQDLSGLDAYLWVKTPGESDGRLFNPGSLHSCLMSHFVECSIACPQYVPKIRGVFRRRKSCQCVDDQGDEDDDYDI